LRITEKYIPIKKYIPITHRSDKISIVTPYLGLVNIGKKEKIEEHYSSKRACTKMYKPFFLLLF